MKRSPLGELALDIMEHLRSLEELGLEGLSREFEVDAFSRLAAVRDELGECARCGLARQRHKIVFGAGDPWARIMFVGEGPGEEEDRQGLPFVGAAGKLLTEMIQAIGLTREQVYIANVVKCRPPANRDPEPEEWSTCFPFLEAQIRAVHPSVIVALGSVAAQILTGTDTPLARLRGCRLDHGGIPLIATYHPAYLLRNPEAKREAWADLKLAREFARQPAEAQASSTHRGPNVGEGVVDVGETKPPATRRGPKSDEGPR